MTEQQDGIKPIPMEAIARVVSEVIEIASSNGANSISMPDDYVAVAHFVSCPEQYAPPSVEALAKEVERLKLLSVENIMLAVDPGDGDGVEVFAKRVEDVVDVLTEISTNLEDTQLVNDSLRTTNAAQAEQLAKLEAGLKQVIDLQEKYYGDGISTHIELKYLALDLRKLLK
jgi:hypothetical protein